MLSSADTDHQPGPPMAGYRRICAQNLDETHDSLYGLIITGLRGDYAVIDSFEDRRVRFFVGWDRRFDQWMTTDESNTFGKVFIGPAYYADFAGTGVGDYAPILSDSADRFHHLAHLAQRQIENNHLRSLDSGSQIPN